MNTLHTPNRLTFAWLVAAATGMLAVHGVAPAQAPGQDAIVFAVAPVIAKGSGGQERVGKGLDAKQDMAIGLKAKVARYTALSMSKGEEGKAIQSAVQRTESTGFNKTCVQDIASNAPGSGLGSGRYGPRGQDQVVVLRGDFINVCR